MFAARVNRCRSPSILMSPLLAWSSCGSARAGAPGQAQHRGEVHQDGVEEDVGSAGVPAQIVRLAGQLLGVGQVTDRAPAVDQVGGGPQWGTSDPMPR